MRPALRGLMRILVLSGNSWSRARNEGASIGTGGQFILRYRSLVEG